MTNITCCELSEFRSSQIISSMILKKKEKFVAKDLQASEVCAEVILTSVEITEIHIENVYCNLGTKWKVLTLIKSREFDVHVTVHHVKNLIIKPTRCTDFSNLFLELNSACCMFSFG